MNEDFATTNINHAYNKTYRNRHISCPIYGPYIRYNAFGNYLSCIGKAYTERCPWKTVHLITIPRMTRRAPPS